MRITVDTNFWISATIWSNRVCNKLLKVMIDNKIIIFSSEDILEEYANVIKRDFNAEIENVRMRIESIKENADVVTPTIKIDRVHDDPSDNKILECAVASESDYVITYDKHLLKLKQFKNIKIVTPEQL